MSFGVIDNRCELCEDEEASYCSDPKSSTKCQTGFGLIAAMGS